MVINQLAEKHNIRKALDLGCGDGAQASAFEIDAYVGVDVSSSAIQQCKERFRAKPNWQFFLSVRGKPG
jgi:methylase of polypeptide subunit release factors